jgi:hypothetical protein
LAGPPLHNRNALLRFDASGNLLWDTFNTAPDTPQDVVSPLQIDALGNVWYEDYYGGTDWRLVKVDAQGQIAWSFPYSDPRGPENGSVGLSIDASGTAHWYMSLLAPASNNPTVHVRVDAAGNPIGTQDLPMSPASNGHSFASRRFGFAGRSLSSQDVLVEVRDEAGQVVWSDVIPVPAGYHHNDYAIPSLDPNGGMLLQLRWATVFFPVTTLEESRRYDSSGRLKWSNGPGTAPCAPDASTIDWTTPTFAPVVVTKYDTPSSGFCYGDGTLTACPCGNDSAIAQAAGCANSFGFGASLAGGGNPSLAADALVLNAQGASGSSLLIAQGTAFHANGAGMPLGDGLRCIGGSIVRIATRPLAGGALQYPQAGDIPISVRGGVVSAGTRTYQGFFRNAAAFCTPSTQNSTNGVIVHWTP